MTPQDRIEIQSMITQAVEQAIKNHRHSGTDSMQIEGSSIRSTPQIATASAPSILAALQKLKILQ